MIVTSTALIKSRIPNAQTIVDGLMKGSRKPDKILFFISEEPHMIDEGIKPHEIPQINNPRVEFIYVENIGSLRKIVPVLKMFWSRKSTQIIICDDDRKIQPDIVKKLTDYQQDINHRFHACGTAGNIWSGMKKEYEKKGAIYKFPYSPHMPQGTGIVLGWVIKEPLQVDILSSGMQTLVKPKFFSEDILHYEKYLEEFGVNRTDEYFISYMLAKKGTKRFVVPINQCPMQLPVKEQLYHQKITAKYKKAQVDEFRETMLEWRK